MSEKILNTVQRIAMCVNCGGDYTESMDVLFISRTGFCYQCSVGFKKNRKNINNTKTIETTVKDVEIETIGI